MTSKFRVITVVYLGSGHSQIHQTTNCRVSVVVYCTDSLVLGSAVSYGVHIVWLPSVVRYVTVSRSGALFIQATHGLVPGLAISYIVV